jgi:rhodanese-related sulfurtransferase
MRSLFAACLLAVTCAGPLACAHGSDASAKAEGFRLIKADELQQLQQKPDASVVVLDANAPEFRKAHGIIPGARLLSSYEKYDVASELPANKGTPLVFYCTSSH